MDDRIYYEFAEAMDKLGKGWKVDPAGNIIEYYKRLYTPEEAQIFVNLPLNQYMTAVQYAEKYGLDVQEASEMLYNASKKGCIYRRYRNGQAEYRQIQMAFGLTEFMEHNRDFETNNLMMMSSHGGGGVDFTIPIPNYRCLPFRKEYVTEGEVEPYDDIELILRTATRLAVAPCMCRTNYPNDCHHPIETCIMTNDMADFYIENEWAREADFDEVYGILMSGEEDGRLIQIPNTQKAENICSCCRDACQALAHVDIFARAPMWKNWSNHKIRRGGDCVNCGDCVESCISGCISIEDGVEKTDYDKCIGCGRCVKYCPMGTRHLVKKPDEEIYVPSANLDRDMFDTAMYRGVLAPDSVYVIED